MKGQARVILRASADGVTPAPLAGEVELTTYGWVHVISPVHERVEGEPEPMTTSLQAVSLPMAQVYRIEWRELKMYL